VRVHPRRLALAAGLAAALLTSACGSSGTAGVSGSGSKTLRLSGSTTVDPVAADAATALRTKSLSITIDDQGGSAGGIAQLGQGQVDIAMSSKPIADTDKVAYPKTDFVTTQIGEDAVGIIVRKEVVEGGLTSITKDQLRRLFEGTVTNWKQLGGPDLKTFVYDKEPGRGTREVLDKFLYGKGGKAPAPPTDNAAYAIVGGNEETRTKLLSTAGSVAPLSTAFAAGQPTLAVLKVGGVEPTPAHIIDKTYPMYRPLFLITNGAPKGPAKAFIDYVLSEAGQMLVTKHGYLTNAQLKG
jgi:phosphate transport system substrate-binding protein